MLSGKTGVSRDSGLPRRLSTVLISVTTNASTLSACVTADLMAGRAIDGNLRLSAKLEVSSFVKHPRIDCACSFAAIAIFRRRKGKFHHGNHGFERGGQANIFHLGL